MVDVGKLEWETSLRVAVARFDELRIRETIADGPGASLSAAESLELLALSEVIARKARYGRQLSVRTARTAGASWAEIGRSIGVSRQSAWETHMRWIESQEARHHAAETEGLDDQQVELARSRAGTPEH